MRAGSGWGPLAGTGRVADELWLLAHDDATGRPFLHPRAAGLGVAGGLLCELLLAGVIRCEPAVVLAPGAGRPGDELAGRVAEVIAAEPGVLGAGEWLAFLGRTAAGDVARRLAAAGYLAAVPGRWRRGARWRPADPDRAFAPITRARAALDPARPVTAEAGTLAGLAVACGLGPRLLAYVPPGSHRNPDDMVAVLPDGQREVIAQVRAAVDSAVLAQRM
ncbi:MAG TPA: GPP34 family phosphoprotein [Streptosporangiaceae bacterium]